MTDKLLQSLAMGIPHAYYMHESEDRVQIIEGPGRFKLLVRHPKYNRWSAYAAMPQKSWLRIQSLIPTELYDYDGPGSDRIVWKDMQHGTMRDVDIFPGHDTVWIGFGDPLADNKLCSTLIERIRVFENRLWELRRAHSVD